MLKIKKPIYTVFQSYQEQSEDYPKGRTVLTLNWQIPTKYEEIEKIIIESFNGLDTNFQLPYGNIENITLYADDIEIDSSHYIIDLIEGNGTVYSTAANNGQKIKITYTPLNPVKVTDEIEGEILIGSCVPNRDNAFQISNKYIIPTITPKFYTNGIYISHNTPIIDTINKTITTDKWYFNYKTGKGVLRSGAALPATLSEITIDYYREIKLDKFELYKIENGLYIYTTYEEVINDPNKIIVNDNINYSSNNYIEEMISDQNGRNYMYYLFAVDSDGNHSICDLQLIETLPSIVQNFVLYTRTGEVNLFWDKVIDPNVNGYNIWRCEGTILQKQNLVKLNSKLITSNEFSDSATNTTNRKSPTEITYPLEAKSYVYLVEAVDEYSSWKVGTENKSSEASENLITQLIPDDK